MIEVSVQEMTVRVRGEATIHCAEQLLLALRGVLESGQRVAAISLAELTDLDTAGVQVLLAFQRATGASPIADCPERMARVIEGLGLAPHLLGATF